MSDLTISEQQQGQADHFDKHLGRTETVNFDLYSQKRFGPWNPYWFVHDFVAQYRREEPQRLLSFGCGTGGDALRFSRFGYEVHGIDISSKRIEIARDLAERYGCGNATFSVAPAESLPFADAFFDLVVGVNVLHHVNLKTALDEVARVLKPGGCAIFKEPLATPRRDRIRNSRLIRWLIPAGVKSIPKGLSYDLSPGERNLSNEDIQLAGRTFANVTVQKWRVLALLNVLIPNRHFLEKCDWALFTIFPFVRRFGDQCVVVLTKQPAQDIRNAVSQ